MKSIPIRNYTECDHRQKIQTSALITDCAVKRPVTVAEPTGHHAHLKDKNSLLVQRGSPYFERRHAFSDSEAHACLALGWLFASWHRLHRAISPPYAAGLRKPQDYSACRLSKPQASQGRLKALSVLLRQEVR